MRDHPEDNHMTRKAFAMSLNNKQPENIAKSLRALASTSLLLAAIGCSGAEEPSRVLAEAESTPNLWLAEGRPSPSTSLEPQALGLAANDPAQASKAPADRELAIIDLPRQQVCQGVRYLNREGAVQSGAKTCSWLECSDQMTIGCKTSASHPSTDIKTIEANKHKIYDGKSIAGVAGTFSSSHYRNCVDTYDSNCTSSKTFLPVERALFHPGVIRAGTKVGKTFVGKYPSEDYKLPPAISVSTLLTPSNVKTAMRTRGKTYHFWNQKGQVQYVVGDDRLHANNIYQNHTIYGIGGNATVAKLRSCDKVGDSNCNLDPSREWLAIKADDVDPKNIKLGIKIAGKTGIYPSAAEPLEGHSYGVADLDVNNHAQLRSDASFEYFTSTGERHLRSGDPKIVPGNIKKGVVVFGVKGTYEGFNHESFNPNDVRTGYKLKPGNHVTTLFPEGYCAKGHPETCYNRVWFQKVPNTYQDHDGKTIHTDKLTDAHCQRGQDYCVLMNRAAHIEYAFALKGPTYTWKEAANYCENLTLNTRSDWRMPTQKELGRAAAHTLHYVGLLELYENGRTPESLRFWSATGAENFSKRVVYRPYHSAFTTEEVASRRDVVCVRKH